jgi:exonuclease III
MFDYRENLVNQIGEKISNEDEYSDSTWSDISDFLVKCKYTQPQFIKSSKPSELKVLSLNIRSLTNSITKISENIVDFQKYDILCFNETNCNMDKLPHGLQDLELEGFHPPYVQAPARKTCKGGGLATYINKNLCDFDNSQQIDLKLDPSVNEGEFLFVKAKFCKGFNKTVIIGNVYRSPSGKHESFMRQYETVLNKLNRHSSKHILVVGDFNTDLMKHSTDINSQNIIDVTTNHGFIQVISKPTRITDHSCTLIDHIYTNKLQNVTSTSVVTFDLSDHLGTTITLLLDGKFDRTVNINHARSGPPVNNEYRMFNEASDKKFGELISNENWSELLEDTNATAEVQYNQFIEIYTRHYNTAYPLKQNRERRRNERTNPKPWILPWLEDACARKNKMYHDFVTDPCIAKKTKYQKIKRFVDKHTKLAKNEYYKKYFDQYRDDGKKQWSMINQLLNRSTKKVKVNKLCDSNGDIVNNPTDIAEKFNEYFSNIASNLKKKIGERTSLSNTNFEKFLHPPVSNSIYLRPVEPNEVYGIIKDLKNKATLDTRIGPLKIANSNFKFTHTLAKIITASFEQGIFPQSLKLARVVPIFKAGSKTDVSNYRPISLLSSISKIYEKLMHNRLVTFLNSNNSLYECQYGFRTGRSCEHALLTAQKTILDALNKREIALLLLIDFSKAFDMVEHSILLRKLENYGIRGIALNWVKSYLSNREQFVTVSGKDSAKSEMAYGVPQGSILGPLLFIIYINDIPEISKLAKFILYADDANIIVTGNTITEVNEKILALANTLLEWVDSNGLALNLKKTHYVIFSRQRLDNDALSLNMANTPIERKTEARFLGVIVDEKMTWKSHITAIKIKMSRYIGIMYRLRGVLPIQARKQIFHSFVQSHLNYCSLIWGFSSKSNIEALFTKQKKGIRAIMPGRVNYYFKDGKLPTHTKPGFNELGVMTVHNIIVQNTLLLLFKISGSLHSTVPISVVNTIDLDAPTHGSTHDTCRDWLDNYNCTLTRNSLFFKGPLLKIDPELSQTLLSPTSLLSIKALRGNIKRTLLDIQKRGDFNEWQSENFILFNIKGLRQSSR